jgi:ribonuclease Z
MVKLIILGSAAAVPNEQHENTHFALLGEQRSILVDCVGNPIVRLGQAGVDFNQVSDLILTHFHPDHVSSAPLLLLDMWLLQRTRPLVIHGLAYTLDRLETLMDLYDWKTWEGIYPVTFHCLPEAEMAPVMESREFRILASPVRHLLPTIGLRCEFPESGKTLAYSCDTEPCEQVARLAWRADLLIHEATGSHVGHSSAAQAGEIARIAQARALWLIHYPPGLPNPQVLVEEAGQTFPGPVTLAQDFSGLTF